MKIFETHAHYDDEAFDGDREELFQQMFESNIDKIINVGASMASSRSSIELAASHENIYAAIGAHPDDIETLTDADMKWMYDTAVSEKKVVAIGEIGLDYHYPEPEKSVQIEWFRRQLAVAVKAGKPIIVHSREAFRDTFESLKKEHADKVGGIIHCYSYSKECVKQFAGLGFYFGIGGVVTFKNAKKVVEAVKAIPMDRLLLETDGPYLAPEPVRGRRNYSGNIPYIVSKISDIKQVNEQEVIDVTNENARRLFNIAD